MAPTIDSLTDGELRRAFDAGSFSRGKAYAHAGRVTVLSVDEDGSAATAEVRGTDPQVYSTTVEVRETRAGGTHIAGTCTCFVGFNCKHVVAVIIALRGSIGALEPAVEESAEPVVALPQDAWRRRATARPTQPQWRSALAPLVGDTSRRRTDWALRIDLVPSYYQGDALLSARPLRRGAKGKWIKTGATWPDVEAATRGRGGDPQIDALAELQVAVRSHYSHVRRSDGTIDLGGLTRDAWRVFDALQESGVALLGPENATVTIVREPVAVTLDVSPHEDGGLLVSANLSDADIAEAHAHDRTMLIGHPAHGIAAWDDEHPTRLWLAPLEEPLDQSLRTLVVNRHGVRVPEADAAEFLRDFYPRLQRALGSVRVDPSIDVPEIVPPRLAVTVTHDGLSAQVVWGFVYEIDGAPVRTGWGGTESFRDRSAEQDLVHDLVPPPGLPVTSDATGRALLVPKATLDGYAAVVLSEEVLPALTAAGVEVEVVGDRPDYRRAEVAPVVHISLEDGKDPRSDWYDLAVTVTIEGEKVHFGPLFAALAAGESHVVLLSGTYLSIDRPELVQLRELIQEARELTDRRSDKLRVNRFHAGLWDELMALGVVEKQSSRWKESVAAISSLDEVPMPDVPAGLHAELRPYQRDGFAWLSFLADHGLGGILADDMGLGKTVQALAMIVRQVERGSGPFLVVAPTSVVGNWAREAQRFAPGLKVATISATRARRRTELADEIAGADLVITSYALFRIENDAYTAASWAGLLLDEAQFVKNHQGKTYQCARRLDAPFKLAITGTPLENSLMDLWSMLSIVAPGLYPDPQRFVAGYQKPIETGHGRDRLALLQKRIRPLMRRRTKDEVAADLPPKTEQVLEVALSPRHARIYQTHLQRERQKVMGLLADESSDHRFEVLRSLTQLRLLSLDPGLLDEEYDDVGSAKIDVLMEHLQEVTAEGHRALVFSQFTKYLARVRRRLDDAGMGYAYLDGRTSNRQAAVDQFTSGERSVFLISLKAGGFGLNLTEADYCYVLDPWWNPAAEAQAVDRAHRIGQTRPVMVYRLVSADTIEEKVMELKARKSALFDAVMDEDAALSGALTTDDIRGLLGV
ncbi:DEAD/DEAH box helicase [Aeromicrobium wangtongii]|uniref:DEAD/DEAH box helicase n=1 Tax=Aeromicrobium wangtongii TaxID=2969247 RepID=UPI002016BEB4|nr:DEAD/DEAH box helicase [Aeromicrobium wangtongii]MCL3818987.1 DEAD/DEAH box helicase [Aeromicrobium wangtongii]